MTHNAINFYRAVVRKNNTMRDAETHACTAATGSCSVKRIKHTALLFARHTASLVAH
jgi:hypothetical protein